MMKFCRYSPRQNKENHKLPSLTTPLPLKKDFRITIKNLQTTEKARKKLERDRNCSESTYQSARKAKYLKPLVIPLWDHLLIKSPGNKNQLSSVKISRKRAASMATSPKARIQQAAIQKSLVEQQDSVKQFIIQRPRRATWDQKVAITQPIQQFQGLQQSVILLKTEQFLEGDSLKELFPL